MKLFKFLNRIVTHCLAVVALLFSGACGYEIMRQYLKMWKKGEKARRKSSEQ